MLISNIDFLLKVCYTYILVSYRPIEPIRT